MFLSMRPSGPLGSFLGLLIAFGSARAQPVEPTRYRLEGRITAADTGRPLAGARVRVLVEGVPAWPVVEGVSAADGRYVVDLPVGHAHLFGVHAPPGYYTQSPTTYGPLVTSVAEPRVVRDFALKPGMPWRVELDGVEAPLAKPPLFSAERNPSRPRTRAGETILVTGDAQGKGVLTIPPDGGTYRFTALLLPSPARYEAAPALLEVDPGFDPRHVRGEPVPDRDAVRLRDEAGRGATVKGAQVVTEKGQAVLRFRARPLSRETVLAFRVAAADEAGKPIAGAGFTVVFHRHVEYSGRAAWMTNLKAVTGADGKAELGGVRLPEQPDERPDRVSVVVVKAGYGGVHTPEQHLADLQRTGVGDFGTVVLKPGRTLRGRVVDETGRPLHGAVVLNHTDHFVYSHLGCRTGADGRFAMPELSYGTQQLAAYYGQRYAFVEFAFDGNAGECLLTVRPASE